MKRLAFPLKEYTMSTTAILLAAGSSQRMNGTNKQLAKINGVPTFIMSALALERSKSVDEIVVVAREEDETRFRALLTGYKITKFTTLVMGGKTRHFSVMNGVAAVSESCDFIAVHDSARPLVSVEAIDNVIADAKKYGAAFLAVPVKDTIKVIDESGFISDTPDRATLYSAQTPQVFRKAEFIQAAEKLGNSAINATDDCRIIELTGGKVHITLGEYSNIKITTEDDLAIANILDEKRRQVTFK